MGTSCHGACGAVCLGAEVDGSVDTVAVEASRERCWLSRQGRGPMCSCPGSRWERRLAEVWTGALRAVPPGAGSHDVARPRGGLACPLRSGGGPRHPPEQRAAGEGGSAEAGVGHPWGGAQGPGPRGHCLQPPQRSGGPPPPGSRWRVCEGPQETVLETRWASWPHVCFESWWESRNCRLAGARTGAAWTVPHVAGTLQAARPHRTPA